MLTLPNAISLLRAPLALAFLQESITIRLIAIFLAMTTDFLDGFLARSWHRISRLGAILDPLMDKLFVLAALVTFLLESRLNNQEAVTLLCRDFSVMLFGIYLTARRELSSYQFRSIWSGKLTTTCQFFVLIALTIGVAIPPVYYSIFVLLGLLALAELYFTRDAQIA